MSIEQSHGVARPTLPRSRDLPTAPIVVTPSGATTGGNGAVDRRPDGRFAPGNHAAVGSGLKRDLRRMLGAEGATNETTIGLARDTARRFDAIMSEMPATGAQVEGLVAMRARHEVLAGYFTKLATERGLDTDEGIAAAAVATEHGRRAERLAISSLDIAIRMAKREPAPLDLDAINERAERETQARRDEEARRLAEREATE